MIVLDGKISDKNTHSLPTEWLGARLVAWMFDEAGGSKWWLCALTCEGDYRYASHDNQHKPPLDHVEYARNVNRFVNRVANHGGAWVSGWFDDVRFYMLWKDKDGDLQIPIECDLGWERIKEWKPEDWAEQAEQAHALWKAHWDDLEVSRSQQVCLAQGQKLRH